MKTSSLKCWAFWLAMVVGISFASALPNSGKHDAAYLKAIGISNPSNANTSASDKYGFYPLQCTSYVAFKLNQAGIKFDNYYLGTRWSDASKWKSVATGLGLTVSSKPMVGSVAWFSKPGHVAYVAGVSGSSAQIVEYNYAFESYTSRTVKADAYIIMKRPSLSPPVIELNANGAITNNDLKPSKNDGTLLETTASKSVVFSIAIRNTGKSDLTITSVAMKSNNTLKITRVPKSTVKAGSYSVVEVTVKSSKKGTFEDDLIVKSNAPNAPTYTIRLRALVK